MVPDWGSKEVSLCVTERDRAAWYLTVQSTGHPPHIWFNQAREKLVLLSEREKMRAPRFRCSCQRECSAQLQGVLIIIGVCGAAALPSSVVCRLC